MTAPWSCSPGDVPLTQADTLRALVAASQAVPGGQLALLTVTMDDPTGYGRIVRNADGAVQGIVEHKDASEAQRAIDRDLQRHHGRARTPAARLAGTPDQ